MGLSSKQVSSSSTGLDWNQTLLQQAQNLEVPKPNHNNNNPSMKKQQQQQQNAQHQQSSEAVTCPRCDSTNTKFCYYNNYNKSQPRHFCRSCKRHWTKGGTLRNVPVGGGRKNKRPKKSTAAKTTTSSSISTTTTITEDLPPLPPPPLYNSLVLPPEEQNLMSCSKDSEVKDSIFMNLPPRSQGLFFPFSTSSTFEANPCSVSGSSNVYNYGEVFKTMEDLPTNNTSVVTTTNNNAQIWDMPSTTTTSAAGMEISNYWGWEDLDPLVSTDLNVPWDDSDIKP